MFNNPEQFANATKTLFDLQMQTFNALATKAVQGVEQVVALNLATAKQSMENTLEASRQFSQAPDPKTAIDALQARVQPGVTEATAYGEQLKQIIGDIKSEFEQAADTHLAEAKNTLSALIYDVTRNVKRGQDIAVEIFKAARGNAFKGSEAVTQSTRDAMRRVEEEVARATERLKAAQSQAPTSH
jgi:phasin family protein